MAVTCCRPLSHNLQVPDELPVWKFLIFHALQGEAIINVAPKKANWDLRRDVAKKLEKLERRTQRALVAIMQEQQKHMLEREEGQAA